MLTSSRGLWDTSNVTDMRFMFYVRSTRALGPQALSWAIPVHASCVPPPPYHHPGPSRLPARTSPPRIACPPHDSAARGGLQPAAELRHLQRHDHGRHVRRALRACPWPPSLDPGHIHTCMPLVVPPPHPRPSRLPGRTSPPGIACPPFDSAVRVGLQPAAELRHLQHHDHELHVLRALRACPWPPAF
jgi:hypothetical protein